MLKIIFEIKIYKNIRISNTTPNSVSTSTCVAVTLARLLHVSKVGQSKGKGKTKQATVISGFHAHESKSTL